jgi:aminomethyltransferase
LTSLKKTPLHPFHVIHGARLVDFSGWEMPVQYKGILQEHRAVRRAAGLFDVSHMGEVDVRGPDAARLLDSLVTNDVSRMFPGRVLYTPMCQPDGGVVDDLLIYMRGPGDFLLCINAGNISKDLAWMRGRAGVFDAVIADRSDDYGLLAVQGPRAAQIVQSLTGAKLGAVKYYHFVEGTVANAACLLSRTGYTGEDGFELYCAAGDAAALAEAILEAGRAWELELCGLGARDSLRLEAGYPLYGHELAPDISPLAAGLGWTVKLGKESDFAGREALAREHREGSPRRVAHFRTGDRRIVRSGEPVLGAGGRPAGRVLSGTLSPILNEAIGSALLETSALEETLSVRIRGEPVALRLTKPPFVELRKG